MKERLALFVLLCTGFLSGLNLSAQHTFTSGAAACHQKKISRPHLISSSSTEDGYFPKSFDVVKYDLDIDIFHCYQFPYPHNFNGSVKITFRADSVINSLVLDAVNTSLDILEVGLAASTFTHQNNKLTIGLGTTYQPGDFFDISIKYLHKNVDDNAFYVSDGFVFTDCEPEGARRWFPCYDRPSDKAMWQLRAKVPSSVKLGSNGILADSVKVADTIWYTWLSEENVATYLMVISSRASYNLDIVNWVNPDNPAQIVPIRFYYNPGENPAYIKSIIGEITTFMSQTFCPHPFPKNGFATLNNEFTWGGMENQTLTSLCPNCWDENLVVHEFAHQWFGDMITCATWADLWLNEGFATYSEGLWLEHKSGYAAYKQDVNQNASYYLSANPGWAISNPDWAINTPPTNVLFNYAITYCKAACILHLLRYTIGDDAFFDVLSQYASHPSLKYESARIPDFVEVVNSVTGEDYTWFFDQWLLTPNHPVYYNTYSFSNLGNGEWAVYFETSQTQTNTGFFKMPLTIRVLGEGGLDTTFRFMNDYNQQGYMFTVSKRPILLYFDQPNDIVLKTSTLLVSDDLSPYGLPLMSPIHPNPVTNTIRCELNLLHAGTVRFGITDIYGKTLTAFPEKAFAAGTQTVELPAHSLKPGMYLLQAHTNGSVITKKFMVAR